MHRSCGEHRTLYSTITTNYLIKLMLHIKQLNPEDMGQIGQISVTRKEHFSSVFLTFINFVSNIKRI